MIANDAIRPELLERRNAEKINPLLAQLTHGAFPAAAAALRSAVDGISRDWDIAVRAAMPQMRRLTVDELSDSTPSILHAIADALGSADPRVIGNLIGCAPQQGLSRLRLNFDLVEVMQEDRLLRAIIVLHLEAALGRHMATLEAAALHADIDLMLQRSVIALVEKQKLSLREAAETELKFLSFMAHDMNNNLNNVSLLLSLLVEEIAHPDGSSAPLTSLRMAQQSIEDTVLGMRKMLQHERLRKAGERQPRSEVDLHLMAELVSRQFFHAAAAKGVAIKVAVPEGVKLMSNGEFIMLVLQNFVGNAVKYSRGGTVCIGVDAAEGSVRSLWVSDQGAGIAPDRMGMIFEAFQRGEVHGQSGVGLGLAIASHAAKLLSAELKVESEIGIGSTFLMVFPTAH